jgi:hypothetical protein
MSRALFSDRPRWAMMPGFVAANLADNVLFFASLCEALGIELVAHYGTLLSAVRLQGIAPWDEDADVYTVGLDLEEAYARLHGPLREHGFGLRWSQKRDAIYVPQVPWIAGQGHIGLSALPELLRDDQDPRAQGWDAYLRSSELYPLHRCAFYGSHLPVPAQPEPVLERLYGDSGSVAVMQRFVRPEPAAERTAFWQRMRPIDGPTDWPSISAHFRRRAAQPPWHAATFPWWWGNGAYNIGVQRVRKLGLALTARLAADEAVDEAVDANTRVKADPEAPPA